MSKLDCSCHWLEEHWWACSTARWTGLPSFQKRDSHEFWHWTAWCAQCTLSSSSALQWRLVDSYLLGISLKSARNTENDSQTAWGVVLKVRLTPKLHTRWWFGKRKGDWNWRRVHQFGGKNGWWMLHKQNDWDEREMRGDWEVKGRCHVRVVTWAGIFPYTQIPLYADDRWTTWWIFTDIRTLRKTP